MSYPVEQLEPKLVWKYFERIRQIPHGSGNEKALGEAIMSWTRELGCTAEKDAIGNVLVRVEASPGCENAPTVVLQGHLDMVCEKNSDKDFDFEKDPIVLLRDGDWIKADGTTLGADNGIGMSMSLALIESQDCAHGPLELLFTVDEETGLNGANALQPGFITGRILFNLDSEEDGIFYVGCAGGRDAEISLPIEREPTPDGHIGLEVFVKGLKGGHSGMDIQINRGNAARLLARALYSQQGVSSMKLASFKAGDKHNAIPREGRATVTMAPGDEKGFREGLARQFKALRSEFEASDPDMSLEVRGTGLPETVMDEASGKRCLQLVQALPHGLLTMSRDIPGLVETSNNLARVSSSEEAIEILTSSRSSSESALDGVIDQIVSTGELAGARVMPHNGYPGWQPNMDSPLIEISREVWTRLVGKEPEYAAVHAGLECGIIGKKYPGIDMLSFGPELHGPHSPDECLQISTVGRAFDFTKALLEAVAK